MVINKSILVIVRIEEAYSVGTYYSNTKKYYSNVNVIVIDCDVIFT